MISALEEKCPLQEFQMVHYSDIHWMGKKRLLSMKKSYLTLIIMGKSLQQAYDG